MDDGSSDGAVSAVAGVSFPVTVMLNPSVPDATDRMQAYRAAGIEVGILAALPASATASDVAIFFEAAFSTLPETVAVLDAGEAGLQADQDVTTQAISALTEDGRGLVTVSRGLNSALRAAEEQGVPTGIIYRNLDAEGQDARVIRRFLDQAAFRARQESGVVLLGQIRGETISALIQWGAANRASQVAMVPISQVLLDEE
nr:divergent polysaccharide deacetylase family protein [Loktanella sp. F6476L]